MFANLSVANTSQYIRASNPDAVQLKLTQCNMSQSSQKKLKIKLMIMKVKWSLSDAPFIQPQSAEQIQGTGRTRISFK